MSADIFETKPDGVSTIDNTMTRFLYILAFASGLLLVQNCSQSPALTARYQAEKLFFTAERASRSLRARPALATPELSHQLHSQYGGALRYCYLMLDSLPQTVYPVEHRELSEIAFRAATRLSQLCYAEKLYDSSVVVLREFMDRVSLSGVANISAHLNLGRAFQAAGQWDSALSVYNYSVERFYPPTDPEGGILVGLFGLPNHIYNVHLRVGDTAAAQTQAVQAENYYRRLITEHPGGNLEGASHLSLASLYERLGRFQEAVNELSRLTDTTGGVPTPAQIRIASLLAGKLERPDQAIEEYDQILARLKGRDTLQRPLIMYNKALVHMHRKEYDRARETMIRVKRDYPKFYDQTPAVQYAIALTFEMQNNLDRAESEYKYLISGFPTSEEGMSTYLYLIEQYARDGRTADVARYEKRAEEQYNEIIVTRPGTRAAAAAMSYKAELYRRRHEWTRTTEILTEVFDKFPTSEIGFRAAVVAILIYRGELGNPAAADSLVQILKRRLTTVDETPNF